MTMAEATRGKGRLNEIGGFWVGQVDRAVMLEFAGEENLDNIDPEGSAEEIALALSLHFKGTTPKSELCKCTECGGESPVSLEACPFCGDAEAIDDGDEDGEEAEPIDRDGEEPPSALVSSPDLAADAGDSEDEDDVEASAEDAPPPPPPSKPAAKAKKEKTKMELVHTNGTNGASTKRAASKALAKVPTTSLATRSLDKAVAKVLKIKADGAESYWTLGKEILEINEQGLWKLRIEADGKAAYKSFDAFVHHELHMSASYAYSAMDVAREYKTADEVRALGSKTKAMLVLKVPVEDRPKVIENAANMSTQQIRDAAKESRAKHGSPKKDKQQAAAGKKGATSPKRESAASDKIAVTSIVGSKTIKLHAKPASMKGIDASAIGALPRAKKLTDQPFGVFEMANGVVQYFSIQQKDGELVLKIETRRKE
jgi:hypothetical protein